VLAEAAAAPDGILGRALKTVLALASDMTHEASVAEFVDKRDRIGAWIVASGSLDAAIADLRRSLELGRDDTVETLRRRIVDDAPFDALTAPLVDCWRRGNDAAAGPASYASDVERAPGAISILLRTTATPRNVFREDRDAVPG
jgi:hypothetical protein